MNRLLNKKLFIVSLLMVLIFIGVQSKCYALPKQYKKNSVALMQAIDGDTLNDGDFCMVFRGDPNTVDNQIEWYILEATSSRTALDGYVYAPTTNPGSKMWVRQSHLPANHWDINEWASFSTAITEIGATKGTLHVTTKKTVSNDTISPATLKLQFDPNGIIHITGYGTGLTINGDIDAGWYQIFDVDANSSVSYSKEIIPQWFGAVADGTTNDTAAIELAITSSSGSLKNIYFPYGKYYVDDVDLQSNIRLYGEGIILVKTPVSAAVNGFHISDIDSVEIDGLYFDGNTPTLSTTPNFQYLIRMENSSRVRIKNCTFYNWGTDAIIGHNATGTMSDVEIGNCAFDGYNYENRAAISFLWVHDLNIHHNYFTKISDNSSNGTAGINVEPGTAGGDCYNIQICNNIFQDLNRGGIICAPGTGDDAIYDVTISGNTFYNLGVDTTSTYNCVHINNGDADVSAYKFRNYLITNNIMNDCYGGVYFRGGCNSTISHNNISKYYHSGITYKEAAAFFTTDYTYGNNDISFNKIHDPDLATNENGIYLLGAKNLKIQHNTILDNNNYGIFFYSSDPNTTWYNTVSIDYNEIGNSDPNNLLQGYGIYASTNAVSTNLTLGKHNIFRNQATPVYNVTGFGINEEMVTVAFPTLRTDIDTLLDTGSNDITATLPDGKFVGQTKTICLYADANSYAGDGGTTVSVTHHETSDPEVALFDAVDKTLVLIWTGTEWATIKATCTFP